jgi:hypothetical protein
MVLTNIVGKFEGSVEWVKLDHMITNKQNNIILTQQCNDLRLPYESFLKKMQGHYIIKGTIKSKYPSFKVLYWGSKPNNIYNSSKEAYNNTSIKGAVMVDNNEFLLRIPYPGAYNNKVKSKSVYCAPHINIYICDSGETHIINLKGEEPVNNKIFICIVVLLLLMLVLYYLYNKK